jgi:hypothetical protein
MVDGLKRNHLATITVRQDSPREGKSTSAQQWCLQRLGRVRYVQLESYGDECSFFRAISRALGTPSGPDLKAGQMRGYIQEAFAGSQLLLVLDEADHLWPRTTRPNKAPARIDWINTALVNKAIPVSLIGTPKFSECISIYDKKCSVWASEQFKGRMADHQRLPAELSDEDLCAIALHLLPTATSGMLKLLASIAKKDEGYVATIERAIHKARFVAQEQGTDGITSDILKQVCLDIVGLDPDKEADAKPVASRQEAPCNDVAITLHERRSARIKRSSVSQSHVLETPTSRRNSPEVVTT